MPSVVSLRCGVSQACDPKRAGAPHGQRTDSNGGKKGESGPERRLERGQQDGNKTAKGQACAVFRPGCAVRRGRDAQGPIALGPNALGLGALA